MCGDPRTCPSSRRSSRPHSANPPGSFTSRRTSVGRTCWSRSKRPACVRSTRPPEARAHGMRTPGTAPLALLAAAALAAGATPGTRAAPRPLWELGLGGGALIFHDYRGADRMHVYPVPVPYLVYRGKFLRSDHNGLRGRLFDAERIQLNLSVNGTTPVRNDSSRHGMPDLRPTVEESLLTGGVPLKLRLSWMRSSSKVPKST